MLNLTAYLAPDGFEADLRREIELDPTARVRDCVGRLFVVERDSSVIAAPIAWAQNTWMDARELPIVSIGDGVRQLRAIQRNWALWPVGHHRRAALIEDGLPRLKPKRLVFGEPLPTAPLGSWTLLRPDLMLAAARCSSAVPHGDMLFEEDRTSAPSRAYLKLWEALTVAGIMPRPGETCLDLGASPGGWTWVIASLGAIVASIDKAPLAPAVATMPGVTQRPGSAFALDPAAEPAVDWLFSDVICYPERLLALVERWLAAGKARRFVCTLKFQGETDFITMARFRAIPGSRLVHLTHNKHELTWIKV